MGVKTPCTLWSRQPQAVFTSNPKPNLSVPLGGGHDKATLAVGALNGSTDASCLPVSPQLYAISQVPVLSSCSLLLRAGHFGFAGPAEEQKHRLVYRWEGGQGN